MEYPKHYVVPLDWGWSEFNGEFVPVYRLATSTIELQGTVQKECVVVDALPCSIGCINCRQTIELRSKNIYEDVNFEKVTHD